MIFDFLHYFLDFIRTYHSEHDFHISRKLILFQRERGGSIDIRTSSHLYENLIMVKFTKILMLYDEEKQN